MTRRSTYLKLVSLFIALFFVMPNVCLCSVKHTSTTEKKVNQQSSHCHDKKGKSDSSSSKKKDCCGDEGHLCTIDLAVDSKEVVKNLTQRAVALAVVPFKSSQFLTYSFVRGSPPTAFIKEFYLRPNPRPTYIQNQTFLI